MKQFTTHTRAQVAAALVRRKQRDSKAGGTRKKSAPLRFSSRTDLLSAGPAGRGRARDRQAGASAPSALGAEAGPGQQAEADRRAALVRCLEVLESLPAGSSYARHRRRVVGKALQLLEVVRCAAPHVAIPLLEVPSICVSLRSHLHAWHIMCGFGNSTRA